MEFRREQLESLQGLGYTWTAIAQMLGVSVHTLLRRRKEYMPVAKRETVSQGLMMINLMKP